jgi:hypothetical protein
MLDDATARAPCHVPKVTVVGCSLPNIRDATSGVGQ